MSMPLTTLQPQLQPQLSQKLPTLNPSIHLSPLPVASPPNHSPDLLQLQASSIDKHHSLAPQCQLNDFLNNSSPVPHHPRNGFVSSHSPTNPADETKAASTNPTNDPVLELFDLSSIDYLNPLVQLPPPPDFSTNPPPSYTGGAGKPSSVSFQSMRGRSSHPPRNSFRPPHHDLPLFPWHQFDPTTLPNSTAFEHILDTTAHNTKRKLDQIIKKNQTGASQRLGQDPNTPTVREDACDAKQPPLLHAPKATMLEFITGSSQGPDRTVWYPYCTWDPYCTAELIRPIIRPFVSKQELDADFERIKAQNRKLHGDGSKLQLENQQTQTPAKKAAQKGSEKKSNQKGKKAVAQEEKQEEEQQQQEQPASPPIPSDAAVNLSQVDTSELYVNELNSSYRTSSIPLSLLSKKIKSTHFDAFSIFIPIERATDPLSAMNAGSLARFVLPRAPSDFTTICRVCKQLVPQHQHQTHLQQHIRYIFTNNPPQFLPHETNSDVASYFCDCCHFAFTSQKEFLYHCDSSFYHTDVYKSNQSGDNDEEEGNDMHRFTLVSDPLQRYQPEFEQYGYQVMALGEKVLWEPRLLYSHIYYFTHSLWDGASTILK